MRLDCDAALALDLQGVEDLLLHFPDGDDPANLYQPV
jgi:hypothetical protein